MTREEFWEWVHTCPTHKFESTDWRDYVSVTFKIDEEESDDDG